VVDCEENQDLVVNSDPHLRADIGRMILRDANALIRIIGGRILKELVDNGIQTQHLWPTAEEFDLLESLPLAEASQGRWLETFLGYEDELQSQGLAFRRSVWLS
jgi:hypothetical protein